MAERYKEIKGGQNTSDSNCNMHHGIFITTSIVPYFSLCVCDLYIYSGKCVLCVSRYIHHEWKAVETCIFITSFTDVWMSGFFNLARIKFCRNNAKILQKADIKESNLNQQQWKIINTGFSQLKLLSQEISHSFSLRQDYSSYFRSSHNVLFVHCPCMLICFWGTPSTFSIKLLLPRMHHWGGTTWGFE